MHELAGEFVMCLLTPGEARQGQAGERPRRGQRHRGITECRGTHGGKAVLAEFTRQLPSTPSIFYVADTCLHLGVHKWNGVYFDLLSNGQAWGIAS